MRNKRPILIIAIGILALAIIGAGVFYAARFTSFFPKESATQEEAVPLWAGLSWQEVSGAVKSQRTDGTSLTRYDLALFGDTIPDSLPGSIKKDDAKAWISSITHKPPLKPGDYSSKWGGEYGFLQYYNDELTKAGFVTDREVLLPSGERIYVGDAEKLDQLIRTFVRIDGGEAKYIVLFKYSVDTDQCSDSEKNIFGTCNLNAEERYGVYYVSSSLDDGTADWKTYRNEKYGFKLTFPESWSVVNVEQRTEVDPLVSIFAWNGDGETLQGKIDGYHFGFETANGVRQDLLTIYVMPESMWRKISSSEPIVIKIQEKSSYVYAYARGCFDCPDELLPARTDVHNVVASFRFND